jgi:hypothetical protein
MEILCDLPDGKIDLSIYSPPFATRDGKGLYVYSSSPRDLSNARTYEEFFEQYEFIVKEIARVTKAGRISAVHCMDVPKQGANICGYSDFPGDIVRLHEKYGFEMLPRICIWKEPLEVRNRTMAKALAHCQIAEDSTLTNCASADYLIPFRKRGKNPTPVAHPHGLLNYAGARKVPHELLEWRGYEGDQIKNKYSHWIWRQYASSIWDDIRGNTGEKFEDAILPYEESRDPDDERHVHPLQLDVISRAVILWSNPNETVFTPFMGVGSEVYGAVVNNRRGIGSELKPSYFKQSVKNMRIALTKVNEEQTELIKM